MFASWTVVVSELPVIRPERFGDDTLVLDRLSVSLDPRIQRLSSNALNGGRIRELSVEKEVPVQMEDEDWLRTQFAFPLVRTNVEGVYTTQPLPDDLDLKTVSEATLLQHGVFLPRPGASGQAGSEAAWKAVSERGLRITAPNLEPLPDSLRGVRRPHGPGPGGSQATSPNWCGCVLEGSGNWRSVTGTVSLPYLSVPSQVQANQLASLSAWVGLDGWGSTGMALFQAVVGFWVDTSTNPPTTAFSDPYWQWWIPDPNDLWSSLPFGSGSITNAPAMKSGDSVQIYCGYVRALDGSNWGSVSFLFYNDLEQVVVPEPVSLKGPPRVAEIPILMNLFFPGPANVQGQGGCIEWIIENEGVTNNQPGTIVPVFSASASQMIPVTFSQALGYSQLEGVTGDPANGSTILWETSSGQVSDVATVTLAPETVSFTYTGP